MINLRCSPYWIPYVLLIVALSLAYMGCKGDQLQKETTGTFVIGVKADPEKLHPFFNPRSKAREVFQNIFLPMADYHPVERTLTPILIDEIPDGEVINDNLIAFDLEIKDAAKWKDGTPITGYDYYIAYKLVIHPNSQCAAWRPYMSIFKSIDIDPENPKSFRVTCDRSLMLTKEVVMTFYPLQEQRYDPAQHLRKYGMSEWSDPDFLSVQIAKDKEVKAVIDSFNLPDTYRSDLHHAGGYQLDKWESDQYVRLTKVEDYWAKGHADNPYLETGMDTLLFKIIKDGNALSTLVKDGGVDMTMYLDSEQYSMLQDDPTYGSEYDFIQFEGMRMAYLGLNNRDPELQDARVRKAVAHSIDVQAILAAETNGLGMPTSVLIHPSKDYYPDQPPRSLDINMANQLLDEAGWQDSDGNGIRDKIVNGKKEELVLDFYASSSNLSKTISLIFNDGAKKAGYRVNTIQKDARAYIGDHVNKHNYEVAALLVSFDDADDDPFPRWHSDNDVIGGKNRSGFSSATTDSLIMLIRAESDATKRNAHYNQFTQILYDEVPVIPLYAPVDLIVVDNRYEGITTSKRPGYMANTFSLK